MLDKTPAREAADWLRSFSEALAAGDVGGAAGLFGEACYWRDLLAFTWTIKTIEGRQAVRAALDATLAAASPSGWRLDGEAAVNDGLTEAWFTFETGAARCEGMVRLAEGRCFTLFTAASELKGFEERRGATRPLGVRHGADRGRETWGEARRREAEALGRSAQPFALIVGGGQGGLGLAARLKQLGVPALVLERNARPGDAWRNRYRSLVLHDPVWYDHMPYLPFPAHWPVFTPKDKMGDWLEIYARVMELDIWTAAECLRAEFDEKQKTWSVEVDRAGERITLRPTHLVFATGAYGPPRTLALPGAEAFNGEILHSSRYADAAGFRGRRVAVIGAASSAHDIAADLWEGGADVVMIQRSPTTVVRSETLMKVGFDLYSEKALARGITVEKADMIAASLPYALMAGRQRRLYETIRRRDADFYRRLEEAGLAIDFGEDGSGQAMKAFRTGSGFYIDVGACDLVIGGHVAVRSGVSVRELTAGGLILSDGTAVEADAVIACTGFQSMHETVAGIVSRDVGDRLGPCWGLGSGVRGDPGPWQGEVRNLWKPTAQENLWVHGGNLALSRFYSRFLAMQLKARMEGVATPVYEG